MLDTYSWPAPDFTSIQERIRQFSTHESKSNMAKCGVNINEGTNSAKESKEKGDVLPEVPLMPFGGSEHDSVHERIPFTEQDYWQWLDWAGREVKQGKLGAIPQGLACILSRLGLDQQQWLDCIKDYGRLFYGAVGSRQSMKARADKQGSGWVCGMGAVSHLYQNAG